MNRKGKSWPLFVVAILIVLFSLTAILGVSYTYGDTKNVYVKGASDIRFGIDIRGGVDVTFMPAGDVDATDEQMAAAKTVIEDRLVGLGITDYESYVDNNKDRIIVRFPWKSDEADFNPQTAIDEIGTTAKMVFRKGSSATGEEILSGDDVASANAAYNETEGWVVQLKFNSNGASAFASATTELAANNGTISIWLDDNNISTATVNEAITGGEAIIKGNFDQDSASTLANQINSGSLPFALSAESYSTISPSLGAKSLDVMVQAGIIAFILVAIMMICRYRLPGTIAVISLMGQVAATLAVVSGYFTVFPGSTLTLPGIAGIILGIGMGVDANVITAERIKEELSKNKTLDGAVKSGFKMGLTPIIDGNVTIVIVAAILMGAFGPTDGFWAKVFNPIFFWFGPSTAGTIYSFGFTLLTSVTPSENPCNGVFLSCFDENAKNYRGLLIRQLDNAQTNIVFGQNVGVTVPGEFDREMHIAIVKDGASYRIYADGLLVAEAESPADSYDGTLLIGAQRDADGNIFRISQTQVNHLSVYAGVMAEADIAAYDFADAPLPPELVAESAAYTMPGAFVGNGSDRALDTGVKLYDVATKDWTLDTVIDVRKGVNNGVYMSCFSEETGHYRGFMLRQDNADTLTAYVGNSVGVTVDLPQEIGRASCRERV